MKLTHEVKAIDHGLKAIKKKFDVLRARGSYVKAGVMGDAKRNDGETLTNAQLASIHEFGLGNVPARPWIRPPFMAKKEEYLSILRRAYERALKSDNLHELDRVLGLLGAKMKADIQNYVTQGNSPLQALTPETIARRKHGGTRPLIDSSQMVDSVTFQVVSGKPSGGGGH